MCCVQCEHTSEAELGSVRHYKDMRRSVCRMEALRNRRRWRYMSGQFDSRATCWRRRWLSMCMWISTSSPPLNNEVKVPSYMETGCDVLWATWADLGDWIRICSTLQRHVQISLQDGGTQKLWKVTVRAWPIWFQSDLLKEAVVRMGKGKLVACGRLPPNPTCATPCRPSCHHWYAGIPSLDTPPAVFPSCDTFSCRVIRDTRSCTRTSSLKAMLQNAMFWRLPSFWKSQAKSAAARIGWRKLGNMSSSSSTFMHNRVK